MTDNDEDFDWDAPIENEMDLDNDPLGLLSDDSRAERPGKSKPKEFNDYLMDVRPEVEREIEKGIAAEEERQRIEKENKKEERKETEEEWKRARKAKNFAWVILGIILASLVWGLEITNEIAESQRAPEPEVVIVPDTQYVTKTVQVNNPTPECVEYLRQTETLASDVEYIANVKTDMVNMLDKQKLLGLSGDSIEVAALQREMKKLDNKVRNAVIIMSESLTAVTKYEAGATPCN